MTISHSTSIIANGCREIFAEIFPKAQRVYNPLGDTFHISAKNSYTFYFGTDSIQIIKHSRGLRTTWFADYEHHDISYADPNLRDNIKNFRRLFCQ